MTELLFDAPVPPFQISKELVFREDAEDAVGDRTAQLIETQGQLIARNAEYSYALTREFQRVQEVARLQIDVSRQMAIANTECQRAEGLQAKLDAVMLEHCPGEMTAEQKANWARHQVPV